MSVNRKLQQEIDRVLKRVVEGIEEFSSTWEKVQTATTQNLKEKYEAELKKDIKKLQRYREQIKTWASSSDVKIKQPLLDARRDIEVEMERFKALEKETKTKAYSKEGLQLQAKRSKSELERKHPNYKGIRWLQEMVERLQSIVDELQEEQNSLGGGRLRGRAQQEFNALQRKIEHHQHHIDKLKYGKGRLQKKLISLSQVEELKEDVIYYVESHDADDFFENEFMYDILDEAPPSDEEEEEDDEDYEDYDDDDDDDDGGENEQDDGRSDPPASDSPPSSSSSSSSSSDRAKKKAELAAKAEQSSKKAAKLQQAKSATTSSSNQQPLLKTSDRSKAPVSSSSSTVRTPTASSKGPQPLAKSSPAPPGYPPLGEDQNKLSMAAMLKSQKQAKSQLQQQQQAKQRAQPGGQPLMVDMGSSPPLGGGSTTSTTSSTSSTTPQPQHGIQRGNQPPNVILGQSNSQLPVGLNKPPAMNMVPQGLGGPMYPAPQQQQGPRQPKPQAPQLRIPPGLEQYMQEALYDVKSQLDRRQRMLEPSLRNLPQPADSERSKTYTPRNPYRTPNYFPSAPDPIFDEPGMFEKFSHDTLFFIFYFQQGTPHQYLAARELKKHSWRYHKKHLTWFQRHGDPKATSEDSEEGSYRYFEYGQRWAPIIKDNFKFEYRWLEES